MTILEVKKKKKLCFLNTLHTTARMMAEILKFYPEQYHTKTPTVCPSKMQEPQSTADQITLPRIYNNPSSEFRPCLFPTSEPAVTSQPTKVIAYQVTSCVRR